MNYENINFHNVAELVKVPNKKGLRVQRVPETLRPKLNERARRMVLSPAANVELRFLLLSDTVDITLSAEGDVPLKMFVFWSGFQERDFYEIASEQTTIRLEINERYKKMNSKYAEKSGYGYQLVRLMFMGDSETALYYHGISHGEIKLPSSDDLPSKTLLSYGTSITHGAKLSAPHLTYPALTAKNLGMDLVNLGLAGACHCENEMADYVANRKDWDIATLALSVNMYNKFSFEEFRERIEYTVNRIAKANPKKPIYCITLFPFFDDVQVYNDVSNRNAEGFRQALRDVVDNYEGDNVFLVEGQELLTNFTLLSPDLIHPNDLGMVQIADNLAKMISSDF